MPAITASRGQRLRGAETSGHRAPAPDLGEVVLRGLFQEWETTGPPGTISLKILALGLGVTLEEILAATAGARAAGLAARDMKRSALCLTPLGYETLFNSMPEGGGP